MLRNKKTGELREPPDSILWTRWLESGDWEQIETGPPKVVETKVDTGFEVEVEKPKESKKRIARSVDYDRTTK
jgi:hypothetical protein